MSLQQDRLDLIALNGKGVMLWKVMEPRMDTTEHECLAAVAMSVKSICICFQLLAFSPAKAAGLRRLGGFHALRGSENGIMRKFVYVEKTLRKTR